jgi:hypothetical protein
VPAMGWRARHEYRWALRAARHVTGSGVPSPEATASSQIVGDERVIRLLSIRLLRPLGPVVRWPVVDVHGMVRMIPIDVAGHRSSVSQRFRVRGHHPAAGVVPIGHLGV